MNIDHLARTRTARKVQKCYNCIFLWTKILTSNTHAVLYVCVGYLCVLCMCVYCVCVCIVCVCIV